MYWVYMDRRMQLKDKKDEAELMTFNLNYERWHELYFPKDAATLASGESFGGTMAADETEIPVTDIDQLDAFFEGRENTKWMTGADISDDDSALLGVGRRV
jgi:hypothetical protein